MYEIDKDAGSRWLTSLRTRLPREGQQVAAIRPALREALDGSTELFAVVVVSDEVLALPTIARRALLAEIERVVREIVLGDTYVAVQGWPLVSFRTEAEDRAAGARL